MHSETRKIIEKIEDVTGLDMFQPENLIKRLFQAYHETAYSPEKPNDRARKKH